MTTYSLTFKPSVEKDLRRIPKSLHERIFASLEGLKTNPFPKQSLKLSGAEKLYRLRVGDYRVIYEIDTQAQRITIHYIRHRRDVYRHM